MVSIDISQVPTLRRKLKEVGSAGVVGGLLGSDLLRALSRGHTPMLLRPRQSITRPHEFMWMSRNAG